MVKQAFATVHQELENPSHFTPTSIEVELTISGLTQTGGDKFTLFDVPIRHLNESDLAKVLGVDGMDPMDVAFIDKVMAMHHKHQIAKVLMDRIK